MCTCMHALQLDLLNKKSQVNVVKKVRGMDEEHNAIEIVRIIFYYN
jgi:hypothetical protein